MALGLSLTEATVAALALSSSIARLGDRARGARDRVRRGLIGVRRSGSQLFFPDARLPFTEGGQAARLPFSEGGSAARLPFSEA